jgi:hypothetical protein
MLDFTPQVGDQVEVFGYRGTFVIRECRVGADGHYRFRLDPLLDGPMLDDIRYPMITYSDEEKVRKALPQILADCRPWPEDIQTKASASSLVYDIRSDEMHDGTPRVMVTFFLKPDALPSLEMAHVRNEFYTRLREQFRFVSIESWLQFSSREERGALSVAS